jgi:hypothetical protein
MKNTIENQRVKKSYIGVAYFLIEIINTKIRLLRSQFFSNVVAISL